MKNKNLLDRKDFLKLAGIGGAASFIAPGTAFGKIMTSGAAQKFNIGATFILWGYGVNNLEPALRDISQLGFSAFETFGQVVENFEENRGDFREIIEKYGIPMRSTFCTANVVNPSVRTGEREKLVRWAKLAKKNGASVIEFNADGVSDRSSYDYRDHKQTIIESMNDFAKAITDEGLVCALHPHTGTAIENEEETYFAMENVDTRYMKFGPDSGQLQKAGADYIKIFRDFMPLIEHVHLKDYEGGDNGYLGYSPLGKGNQEVGTLLDMLEEGRDEMAGMIMFELDYDGRILAPYSMYEAAEISRNYLAELGYQF